jgi:hypothetical protein
MPKIPSDIVKPEIVKEFKTDPNFPFMERLKENNLTDWKPQAPVQLCFCKGDREVSYKNSVVAYNHMKALGVTHIKLNNLSDHLDHNTCAAFAVLATKAFFDRYRKYGKNPKMKDLSPFKKFVIGFAKRKVEKHYEQNHHDHAYM